MAHGAPVPLRVVSRFAIASRDCRRHRPAPRGTTWRKAVRLFREARGRGSRHLPCTGVCYYGHGVPVAMCDPDVSGRTGCAMLERQRILHVGVAGLCWRSPAERERSCRFLRRLQRSVTTKGICEESERVVSGARSRAKPCCSLPRDRLVWFSRPWPMPTEPKRIGACGGGSALLRTVT